MVVDHDGPADGHAGVLCGSKISSYAGGYDHQVCGDHGAVCKEYAFLVDLGGGGGGIDLYAGVLSQGLDHGGGGGIELPCHKGGRAFDDRHFDLGPAQRPCGLQAKYAAADDGRCLDLRDHVLDLRGVLDGADGDHLVQVMSLEGRHEAVGAQGVDQLVVGNLAAAGHDGLSLGIDGFHLNVPYEADPVFVEPLLLLHGHLVVGEIGQEGFGQHGTVVGQVVLTGKDGDIACPVSLPDGPGRFQSGNAASQDQIVPFGIICKACALIAGGNEVLGAHAADGAFLQGGVEDGTADQALDQLPCAFCGLFHFLFQKDAAEVVAEIIGVGQLIGVGFEADPEAVHHLQADLFQSLDDMGNALAGPAVAAEGGSQPSLEYGRIHGKGQVVDGLKSFPQDGGGAEEIAVGGGHIRGQVLLIVEYQVIAADLGAGVLHALCDDFRQLLCIAVGADIGHDHQFLFLLRGSLAPLAVPAEDLVEIRIQYRAVAAADVFDLQIFDPLQSVVHVGIGEGADDAVEIVFSGFGVACLVRHGGPDDAFRGIVGAEGVAGEEGLYLRYIGIHGVRPVEVGQDHEFQGLVPQGQGHAVGDGDAVEILVDDVLEELDGGTGGHHSDVGVQIQELFDGSGVVGLRMVHDQVVDLGNGSHGFDVAYHLVEEGELGCFEKSRLLTALQQVGIVGRTVSGLHDDVEDAQIRVQDACPVQVLSDFESFHT